MRPDFGHFLLPEDPSEKERVRELVKRARLNPKRPSEAWLRVIVGTVKQLGYTNEGHRVLHVDVARMGGWATQRRWLHERTVESLGGLYEMHWPGKQPVTARGLRRLPLHHQHQQAGAFLGQAGGWERPLWFEPGVVRPTVRYDFHDPSWFPAVPARGRCWSIRWSWTGLQSSTRRVP